MSIVSSTMRGIRDRRSMIGSSWGGDESVLGDIHGVGDESEKIHVSIRLKPVINDTETAKNDVVSDWECINSTTIIFKSSMPDRSMLPSAYTFDRAFGQDSSTKQVYEEAAKEVALSVLSGVNASIFAYGQTSSGKTYTMRGITEYAMSDIFQYINQNQEREFVMKFSAMEIYNEAVRDLLSSDPTPLRLVDDPERGTVVDKLIEEPIEDWNHLHELLSICEAQRHIGETALNEFSSRSHQILRLTVESCARDNFDAENSTTLTASLNLIDLAGSERASQTWSTGTRLKEGSHINRSLLTLGTVVRKLSKGKYGHIPYRESKLTRILQNCLGGNAKTAIICTMSPSRCHAEQSRNTLVFASCAKQVSTSAQVNVVMTDKALVKQLQKEISRLEGQVKSFRLVSKASALLREKDLLIEKMEKEMKELTWQRDLAQSHIDSLLKSVGEDRLFRVEENSVPETPDALLARTNNERENDQSSMPSPIPKRQMLETQVSLGANSMQLDNSTPHQSRFNTSNDLEEEIPQRDSCESENICRNFLCVDKESSRLSRTHEAPETEDSTIMKRIGGEAVVLSTIEETKELCNVGSYDIHEILKRRLEELQKTIETLDKSSPSQKGVSWTRSKSKKAVVMTIPSALWSKIEEEDQEDEEDSDEEAYESRHSSSTEEELPERREKSENKATLQLEHLDSEYTKSFAMSKDDEIIKEIDVHFDDKTSVLNSVAGGKKTKKTKHQKQPTREIGVISLVEPLRRTPEGRPQRARDLASETHLRSSNQSQANWSQKFERYRKKIIELWAKCNVPLVHRSYFFLLFKGDPSDNVYLEVELRRLYFIKDTAARGNNPTVDSQVVTYTSSPKNLNRERIMLAKQLQKKFTRREREELYLKWNIDIDTKQRGLQLVGKLWTDMRDMRHVKESSILVVKLIGFVEPQYAPKELFGLSFLNPSANQKSSSWRDNVSSLL